MLGASATSGSCPSSWATAVVRVSSSQQSCRRRRFAQPSRLGSEPFATAGGPWASVSAAVVASSARQCTGSRPAPLASMGGIDRSGRWFRACGGAAGGVRLGDSRNRFGRRRVHRTVEVGIRGDELRLLEVLVDPGIAGAVRKHRRQHRVHPQRTDRIRPPARPRAPGRRCGVLAHTWPLLGDDRRRYRRFRAIFSVFTPRCCNSGISRRQGSHQVAQKLTTRSLPRKDWSVVGGPLRAGRTIAGRSSGILRATAGEGPAEAAGGGAAGSGYRSARSGRVAW
jgi:hypothetical protein